jgi:hypothetical protein
MRNLFLGVFFIGLLAVCKPPMKQNTELIKQGIEGNVRLLTGNAMPMKDAPAAEAKPFETTVYVYPPIKLQEIASFAVNGVYTQLPGKELFSVKTNEKGAFSFPLPEGKYAVFVAYKKGFFANISNAEGYVQPIVVEKNKLSTINITIDADAVY